MDNLVKTSKSLKMQRHATTIQTLPAGQNITKLQIVEMRGDGLLYVADKFGDGKVLGFALSNYLQGDIVTVHVFGLLGGFSDLSISTDFFLGESGGIVEEGALSKAHKKVYVGYAQSSTELFVDIIKYSAVDQGSRSIGDIHAALRSSPIEGELALNGQIILVNTYPKLVELAYVGDSANADADYCYRCENSSGANRSTTGAYFKLPDASGLVPFGVGTNRDISMATGHRYSEEYGYRLDQFQGHLHRFDHHTVGIYDGNPVLGSNSFYGLAPEPEDVNPGVGAPITETLRGPVRYGDKTQSAGFGVYWYVKALQTQSSSNSDGGDSDTGAVSFPIGFTYIQLPGKGSPDELNMPGIWNNISNEFKDRFLRIDGDNTSDFDTGGLQSAQHIILSQVEVVPADTCDDCLPSGILNPLIGDESHDHKLRFSKEGEEERPANVTIRIWQRTL